MDDLIRRVLAKIEEKELEEANATSGGEVYNSKYAFGKGEEEADNERTKKGDKSSGFPNKTERGKMNTEVYDKWEAEILNEVAIPNNDESTSGKSELNKKFIDAINSHTYKIETLINRMANHMKSKQLTPRNVWPSKMDKVYKVERRLIQLAQLFKQTVH